MSKKHVHKARPHDEFLLYGIHTVQALLNKSPERVLRLYVQENKTEAKVLEIIALAKGHAITVEFLSTGRLDHLIVDGNHQGIIAQCAKPKTYSEFELESLINGLTKPAFLLILDNVQDPHNLGACLRSADAAGVDAVIVPKDKAVSLTSTVCKVASGAAEAIPFVQVTNLARTLKDLKDQGIWLTGLAGEGDKNLFQCDFKVPTGLVLGSEGAGLRRLTREYCDYLAHIPMAGSVSSLNVSVAAGVALFEVVRQRGL